MRFPGNLFRKKDTARPASAQARAVPSEPYLSNTVVFGTGDSSVYWIDEARGLRKTLIDPSGMIRHFPGIKRESFWTKEVTSKQLSPRISYRTSFERRGNRWIMLWKIQPDGDYWRDESGFGATNEREITLYTYVDENGDFTDPFRIYQFGERCCCPQDALTQAHLYRYEAELARLRAGEVGCDIEIVFPRIRGMGLSRGFSYLRDDYSLWNRADAIACWEEPLLRAHLKEASGVLLSHRDIPVTRILPYPYQKAVHSSMTIFSRVTDEAVFRDVLSAFYQGEEEPFTAAHLTE